MDYQRLQVAVEVPHGTHRCPELVLPCTCEPGCLVSTQQVTPPAPKKRNINTESLSAANAIKRWTRFLGLPNVSFGSFTPKRIAGNSQTIQKRWSVARSIKRLRGARLLFFFRVSASPHIPNSFAEALFSSFCKSEITVKGFFFLFCFFVARCF